MRNSPKRNFKFSPKKQALLEVLRREENLDSLVAERIPQRKETASVSLSFAQQRLWFLDKLEPGSPAYNLHGAVRLGGPLNLDALEQSLTEIVRRHESLRTTFADEYGIPAQVIAPPKPFGLPVMDLRELPEIERRAEVQRLAAVEARHSFDLSQGPLFRATILRLGEDEHVFLLTMHHIISDAWSMGVFYQELWALYQAFSAGKPSPLPELFIQYADFANWQRNWLKGEVLEGQLSYWKKQLAGAAPVLELSTDRRRPAVQTFQGKRQSLNFSKELTERLKELSGQEEATLFMTLLAAFKTLLYRYTGQTDIVLGSPIANRTRIEIEQLIGFFVNTLVLRTDLSGNPSFRELLSRVRQMAIDAYEQQDLPFEKLVGELQPERNLSHNPLFQVMFILQNAPTEYVGPTDLILSRVRGDREMARFDLTMFMVETKQGLKGELEYNTDLFDAGTIARMLGHFETLLEGIVSDPDQCISDLPLLTVTERHQLLWDWNNTRVDYPRDAGIHRLFEAQVERTPEAVAVVFEDDQLTYRELESQANQLAQHLRVLGVGPDTMVGIYMERSVEMMVGLLGILKAGGAYVPLDPTFPQERLAFMLADSQAPVLLTQQRLLEGMPEHSAQLLCLDQDWFDIAQESEDRPASQVKPTDLAYVIYTSGSTGKPKGVQISHRAAANFLNSMGKRPGLTEQDILLAVTTLSFDIALLELFLPIIVGARVVIVSSEVAADGYQLQERLANSGATVMQATPATWRLLLETDWQGSKQLKVLCGGEGLPRELANQLLERVGSLWNMYGPTETTVWSTVHPVESAKGPILIGCPIDNTQIYILDARLQPVPIGVPGELYIGGDGLARGYFNRPNLTAEKFIPHPFSDEPEARIYNTGDLARYLPDGTIECLGRTDHQVKIRGFRIELGEIEAVLGQHPGLEESVVIVREDVPGDKRLVAYLIAGQEPAPSVGELRSFLKKKLPDYMVPSAFVPLDALPLTPNRKVDRKALPAPDQTRPDVEEAFVLPRTPVEEILAGIWCEVLGIERVGIYDNFFELGGHSLLATRIVSQVNDFFQVQLPLRSFFELPTIDGLVNSIAEICGGSETLAIRVSQLVRELELLSEDDMQM